jgi:hypothetical protein
MELIGPAINKRVAFLQEIPILGRSNHDRHILEFSSFIRPPHLKLSSENGICLEVMQTIIARHRKPGGDYFLIKNSLARFSNILVYKEPQMIGRIPRDLILLNNCLKKKGFLYRHCNVRGHCR